MTTALRILAFSPFMPYPPDHGGRIRTYLLLRELARHGHDVHLVALTEKAEENRHLEALAADGIRAEAVVHPRRFGKLTASDRARKGMNLLAGRSDVLARFASDAAVAAGRRHRDRWDVVIAELLWTAPLALAVDADCHVLNAHNVETLIARRTRAAAPGAVARVATALEARGMRRDEKRLVDRFDAVVVVSDEDRRHMLDLVPDASVDVVENCVDTEVLRPLPTPSADGPTCLFMGSPNYPPNAAAIERFARHVFPRIRAAAGAAQFLAVGANPPPHLVQLAAETPGFEMVGYVENIVPSYAEASVVVVPLDVGGGTRTKILEAFALGRPVVSTALGAEGLPTTSGEHLILAESPEAFAAAVLALEGDPARRQRMVEAARGLVEAHGSARVAGERFAKVVTQARARRAGR